MAPSGGFLRVASFQLKKFFDRPKALNQRHWQESKPILRPVTDAC